MRDVLVRSFAPLNALDNVLQIGLFTVASLGGGTVLGVEYGPWQGAVATSGLVAVLLLFGALRTQVELENLRGAPRPHLKFLDGQIEEVGWLPDPKASAPGLAAASASAHGSPAVGTSAELLRFGRVLVTNEPPSRTTGEDARSVGARMTFVGAETGHYLALDCRWARSPQAPERHPFTSDINPAIDLPADSRVEGVDVVVQDPKDGKWFAFNDRNAAARRARYTPHALPDSVYKVVVTMRGANTPAVTEAYLLDKDASGHARLLREDMIPLYRP